MYLGFYLAPIVLNPGTGGETYVYLFNFWICSKDIDDYLYSSSNLCFLITITRFTLQLLH